MCAARHGRLDLIELLLEFGAEVDAQDKVSTDCREANFIIFHMYRMVALL